MTIRNIIKKLRKWFLADDIGESPKISSRMSSRPLNPNPALPPGRIVNRESTMRSIQTEIGAVTETTYETQDGLETRREAPVYINTCCDRLIDQPYAICICGRWICGPEHHVLCFRCGHSLCPKCRKFFRNNLDPQGGFVPLCKNDFEICKITGTVDGEWDR